MLNHQSILIIIQKLIIGFLLSRTDLLQHLVFFNGLLQIIVILHVHFQQEAFSCIKMDINDVL